MKSVQALPSPLEVNLPEPVGYFRRGEKLYHSPMCPRNERNWNGDLHIRGNSRNGIPAEVRRETDCRDYDGVLTVLSEFYPSEYSEQTLRLRKIEKLPKGASKGLLRHFHAYQDRWGELVGQDRSGTPVRAKAGDRIARDYVHRRRRATHPLRHKNWARVVSVPVTAEIKAELKEHLKLDWRKTKGLRLLRFGKQVALSYVIKEQRVHEVNLEERTINSCRDPRLVDMGICLNHHGLSYVIQNPTEQFAARCIPIHQLTKQFINTLVTEMTGKVRLISIDPVFPAKLRGIKAYLTRKLRALQAEGAIEFRSPKLVSLGATYKDLPRHHPQHLSVRQRKDMQQWFEYGRMLGLTGKPLMVKELDGSVVDADDRHVNPLVRANHALQSAMAKLDLWHGATFLRSVSSQSVRKAFHRYRCEQHKRENQHKGHRPWPRGVDRIPLRGSTVMDLPPSPAKRGSATASR